MSRNITLTLRVSPQRAIQILNRLYGCGEISREKYLQRVAGLKKELADEQAKKQKLQDERLSNLRVFYKTVKKTTE